MASTNPSDSQSNDECDLQEKSTVESSPSVAGGDQVRRSPRLAARPSPKPTPKKSPKRLVFTDAADSNKDKDKENKQPNELSTTAAAAAASAPTVEPTALASKQAAEGVESELGACGGGAIGNQPFEIELIVDGVSSYAVVPLTYCPHLLELHESPSSQQVDTRQPCSQCGDCTENWLCLTCMRVFCSRYVRGHAAEHFDASAHAMTLSFSDLSVWCYACESYVDNSRLDAFKQAAYASKFST